jgi:hypothetical protein
MLKPMLPSEALENAIAEVERRSLVDRYGDSLLRQSLEMVRELEGRAKDAIAELIPATSQMAVEAGLLSEGNEYDSYEFAQAFPETGELHDIVAPLECDVDDSTQCQMRAGLYPWPHTSEGVAR